MAGKFTFIINPIAGPGDNQKFWNKLVRQLTKLQLPFRAKFTERQNHAAELVLNRLKKEPDAKIVSLGGDGTFNEVASSLINTETTLAHIPRGSGNGLARMLSLPGKSKHIPSYLSRGKTKLIDVGRINQQYFFCTAGFGFDALISHHFATSKTRGLKGYIFYIFKTFFSYKGVAAKFELDGKQFDGQFFTVTFANANQFGNNAFIAPKAKLNDGLLDITIIRPFPRVYTPIVVLALFCKFIHRFSFVETLKIKSAKIYHLSQPHFHRDGDDSELHLPAEIRVIPKGLRLLVP